MATYAIGDIQGCFDEFSDLLKLIKFKSDRDTLWLVGDLVNRGPKSLQTLRYVRDLGENAISILGNHDLHLIACFVLDRMNPTSKDTTQQILDASDCADLIDWLRHRHLAFHSDELSFTMIHAGAPPTWTVADIIQQAGEVESALRADDYRDLIDHMYGDEPSMWSPNLSGFARLRFTINALTRLRFCDERGGIDMKYKGPLGSQPAALTPWFELSQRPKSERIVFGHWSSLRLSQQEQDSFGVYPVDTGAVWGDHLTALRLDDQKIFSVPSSIALPIK